MANLRTKDADESIKEHDMLGAGTAADPHKNPGTDVLTFSPVGAHIGAALGTTVVTLTPPAGATKAMLQIRVANVRMTLDGTNPVAGTTTGLGFLMFSDSQPITIPIRTGTSIKLLEETASSGARYQLQWGK